MNVFSKLGILVGLVSLNACSNVQTKSKVESNLTEVVPVETIEVEEDTVYAVIQERDLPFQDSENLAIYALQFYQEPDESMTGFIPLSDSYKWTEAVDSQYISDKYLGSRYTGHNNFHRLNTANRSLYLRGCGIQEEDNVFIYSIYKDVIKQLKVSDLSLVAFISPYGAQSILSQYHYQLGFYLEDIDLADHDYNSLVYIGKTNRFEMSGLQMIEWNALDSRQFPSPKKSKDDSLMLLNSKPLDAFVFPTDGKSVFLQNYGRDDRNGTVAREIVILSSRSREVLFRRVYYDSEGSYLLPLNGYQSQEPPYQFIGNLFRHQPEVIFGFTGTSFGCPWIDHIDTNRRSIIIRCDNRH